MSAVNGSEARKKRPGRVVDLPDQVALTDGVDLRLRRPTEFDKPDLIEMYQDPVSQQWTGAVIPFGERDVSNLLAIYNSTWIMGTRAMFVIELDGKFAGIAGMLFPDPLTASVTYTVAPWARGNGVATRSVRAMLGWAFGDLEVQIARWEAMIGNDASLGVAENCGFRVLSEHIRGGFYQRGTIHDTWFGTITAAEFGEL